MIHKKDGDLVNPLTQGGEEIGRTSNKQGKPNYLAIFVWGFYILSLIALAAWLWPKPASASYTPCAGQVEVTTKRGDKICIEYGQDLGRGVKSNWSAGK